MKKKIKNNFIPHPKFGDQLYRYQYQHTYTFLSELYFQLQFPKQSFFLNPTSYFTLGGTHYFNEQEKNRFAKKEKSTSKKSMLLRSDLIKVYFVLLISVDCSLFFRRKDEKKQLSLKVMSHAMQCMNFATNNNNPIGFFTVHGTCS